MAKRKNTPDDFYRRIEVDEETGCWLMPTVFHDRDGYGYFRLFDRDWKTHRLSAYLSGRDPTGWYVCHHCDRPGCVNPDHLFIGTARDNALDRSQKGRSRGNTLRGAERPSTQPLSSAKVRKIKRYWQSGRSARSLESVIGCHRTTILKYWQRFNREYHEQQQSVHTDLQGESID